MKAFCESLKNFKQNKDKFRIAVFRPVKSTNDRLYQTVVEHLSSTCYVEVVNSFFLYSYEAMFKNHFDILVILESELLIMQDCHRIRDYVIQGGALIFSGSNMLMQEISKTGEKQKSYFGDKDKISDNVLKKYSQTTARIGVKPYVADVSPTKARFDTDFVHGISDVWQDMPLSEESAKMNTTSCLRTPQPYAGTCYPERHEVLRNYEVVSGHDEFGRKLTTAVNFSQNYETGARVCLFASDAEHSFLNSDNPYFVNLLDSAVAFCRNKLMFGLFESSYACYRDGETPVMEYNIHSFATCEKTVYVKARVTSGDKTVYETKIHHIIKPGEKITGHYIWENPVFDTDYYDIHVELYENETLLSKADNAFVIWNDEVIRQGREVFCDGEYFSKDGKKGTLLGTNYYDSSSGGAMWVYPDIARLNADLKDMADFGIEYVRVHYHHPKWFYDFLMQKYGEVPERYRTFGDSYLPSEKHLRVFDAHVYLCQKYHMITAYDLFTLIPEEMGDPRGWGGVHDYICLEEKIEKQKEFLNQIIPRYTYVPGMMWDIYNENHHTALTSDTYYRFAEPVSYWIEEMRDYIHSLGEKHPVTAGGYENFLDEGVDAPHDIVDYLALHTTWQNTPRLKRDNFTGPQMFQEAWLDRTFTPEGDQAQLSDMRYALINVYRTGLAGFMPWQWTEQLAVWQAEGTYYGENWDDRLGCCVHNNGAMKPAGRFFRDFIHLVSDIELDRYLGDSRIQTKDGIMTFGVPEEVGVGDSYMVYEKDGIAVRGIAMGRITKENFSLVTDCDECNVFYAFSPDGSVYFKADAPCKLTASFAGNIRKATLTDGKTEKELPVCGNVLSMDVADWQIYYWIKAEF